MVVWLAAVVENCLKAVITDVIANNAASIRNAAAVTAFFNSRHVLPGVLLDRLCYVMVESRLRATCYMARLHGKPE